MNSSTIYRQNVFPLFFFSLLFSSSFFLNHQFL